MAAALGAEVEGPAGVRDAVRHRERQVWTRALEPVLVAWGGRLAPVSVRLPAGSNGPGRGLHWSLEMEGGDEWDVTPVFAAAMATARRARLARVDGHAVSELVIRPAMDVPVGYHRLRFESPHAAAIATVISAPAPARLPTTEPAWGVFLPLYALRSERSWGTGDVGDLARLAEWAAELGGGVTATLPMLASFLLDEPFEPSPYSPASRLFWNELYVDVAEAPELERSPEARTLVGSGAFRRHVAELRDGPLVDYRKAFAAKRRVLELLARTFFSGEATPRRESFETFERGSRRATDYAAFMAATERHRSSWSQWPQPERDGQLPTEGGDPDASRYHRYVQWLMAEQVAQTADRARRAGAGLYFDLPVGVNRSGYDVWRERDAFALQASAGAPPDTFFAGGQDWGFPPLHPDGIREQGYRYFAECVRHSLRHATVLRIDHVMALHRLYWVPPGVDAKHGAYVRYRSEEFHAVLAIESRRANATIVGEDLGTVPAAVRWAMARQGICRSYALQMELQPTARRAVHPPPRHSLAGLNSHDMPPFAAFWRHADERLRRALTAFLKARGLLTGRPSQRAVLSACLRYLGESEALIVLVNVEDLWLETLPQNVPGTVEEYPNWRRRARYALEGFRGMPGVVGTLVEIDGARKGRKERP